LEQLGTGLPKLKRIGGGGSGKSNLTAKKSRSTERLILDRRLGQ
jgi:hypothetical protein